MGLVELCLLMLLYNAMTFGNGPVMVPLLEEELVERRGVLGADELLYAFTLARVTPGQANTYVAAVGYLLHGVPGALATTAAIVAPGYLVLPLLSGYERIRAVRAVPAFTHGLTVASVGLIFAAIVDIAGTTLTSWLAWVVFAGALAMAQLLRWHPLVVVGLSALVGLGGRALGWA